MYISMIFCYKKYILIEDTYAQKQSIKTIQNIKQAKKCVYRQKQLHTHTF